MKIDVTPRKKDFEPIEVTFTIENLDELLMFWHRMDTSWDEIFGGAISQFWDRVRVTDVWHQAWAVFDNICKEYGIDPHEVIKDKEGN